MKVGCKKVCLTLRKEGGEWRYYRYDKQDDKLEPFQPPPGRNGWKIGLFFSRFSGFLGVGKTTFGEIRRFLNLI